MTRRQLGLFDSLPAGIPPARVAPLPVSASERARRAARTLAHDVLLRAGAGTGKTHTLIEVVVHLTAGVTALGRRVPPSRLLVLTFSDKAAAELRARVRARFATLAASPRDDGALEEAYARAGATPLGGDDWLRAAHELGGASIGTFHAHAAGILRRHASAAGLDPGFAILLEDEAALWRRTRAQEAVLSALDEPARPDRDALRQLVVELDWSYGEGARAAGLLEHVVDLGARLADAGLPAGILAAAGDDPGAAGASFAAARDAYLAALDDLVDALDPALLRRSTAAAAGKHEEVQRLRPAAARALAAASCAIDVASLRELAAVQALRATGTPERHAAKARLVEAFGAMREAHAAVRAAPLAAAFAALVDRAEGAYRAAKTAHGVLDFADLIARARDLLAGDENVREEERARFDAVLVDELQDTNDLQDELVQLTRAPGAPLLAVGDPKQSIYEFRGADVSVFERVAARVEASGGEVAHLAESFRARRALVEVQNRLFVRGLAGGAHPFEIAFDPARDALQPTREGAEPCVELLGGTAGVAAGGEPEPRVVAARIAELVASGAARCGDVAVLLRRFTRLDAYLGELRAAGLPYYVVNGRGFHEAQEVRDLCHALALLEDDHDALALLGVLRSPLVGLSDAALVALAELSPPREDGRPGALSAGPLLAAGFTPPASLDAGERERLSRYLALHARLRRHGDRLGAAGLLRLVCDETDLAAVLATTWHGEQRVANLDKLLALAEAHDDAGRGGWRAFARRLRADVSRAESLAPPAQLLGEYEDVVRVMTVHQAKGLDFPIVFVPECGVPERESAPSVVWDRAAGLGFRVRGEPGDRVSSPRAAAAQALRAARARAESARIFYVAATRARDRLVLSGEPRPGTWRALVDDVLAADPEARALVVDVVPGPAPRVAMSASPAAPATPATPATQATMDDEGAGVISGPPAGAPRVLVAPVTELADFEACPRRYQLKHEIGLEEHVARAAGAAAARSAQPGTSALERGTLAHRLLAEVDLARLAAGRGKGRALALVEALLAPGASEDDRAVARQVAAFLCSRFGAELAARAAGSTLRELPFAFAAGGEGQTPRLLVKGQMDLVLLDDDAVTVLDYKLARSGSGPGYAFQLTTYALAARALWGRPARAGLVYLLDRAPAPRWLDLDDARLDDARARLEHIARDLGGARRLAVFQGREVDRCQALACGYLSRCHPSPRGGAEAR